MPVPAPDGTRGRRPRGRRCAAHAGLEHRVGQLRAEDVVLRWFEVAEALGEGRECLLE